MNFTEFNDFLLKSARFQAKTVKIPHTNALSTVHLCLLLDSMAHEEFVDQHFWESSIIRFYMAIAITEKTLDSKNFKAFLRQRHEFDVVIVEMLMPDACLAFGHYFKAPVIALTPYPSPTWFSEVAPLPIFPADLLNLRRMDLRHMSIFERLTNSLTFWVDEILKHWIYLPRQQKFVDAIFSNNSATAPSFLEIRQNVTMVLLDSYTAFNTPRSYLPNLMKIDSLYAKARPAALPANVRKFLDDAHDGAIFISLGSNVNLTKLGEAEKTALCNAFEQHPNIRLLIKAEDDSLVFSSHRREDVLVDSWYSQDSALAHPNVRVFVTFGDIISTTGKRGGIF